MIECVCRCHGKSIAGEWRKYKNAQHSYPDYDFCRESQKRCEVVKKETMPKGYVIFWKKRHLGGTSKEKYKGNPFDKKFT